MNERTSADVLEQALQVILEAVEHDRVDVEQARQLVRARGLVGAARVVDPIRAPESPPQLRNGYPAA